MTPVDLPRRTCILVLGMHRSGTSAITRVLSLLGAALPHHLVDADPTNEAGFWEPARLVQINDSMLTELSSRWDDWRAFDPAALGAAKLAQYKSAIREAIAAEFGDASLFVIKDPRICRFAPLYESILAEMGVATRFVLIHRNPLSVLASLKRRDQIGTDYGALVWLRHVLDAEISTRGKDRVFVSYEQLMDDWSLAASEIATALGIDWPIGGQASELIDRHLRRNLQHHAASPADVIPGSLVGGAVRDTYQSLLALLHQESASSTLAILDRIKAALDSGTPVFADALFEEMAVRQQRETLNHEHLVRLVAKRQGEMEALAKEIELKDARLAALEASYRQSDLRGTELTKLLAYAEVQSAAMVTREAGLLKELQERCSEVAELEELKATEREKFKVTVSELETRIDQERELLQRLAADNEKVNSQITRENIELHDQIRALSQARDTARSDEQQARDMLQAIYGSTSWRITRPIRSIRKKATEFRVVATSVLRLIRERRLTSATVARGVRQLPRLISEGKLSSPTSFSELAETLDPESVSRIQSAFDQEFYLRNNPDIAMSGVDAFSHFLAYGWKEYRDPSADFSVSYYLQRYPDIARAGINPFIHYVLHGQGEKRTALSYKRRLERRDVRPKVTAIVPNYNHARFLEQRLESILSQTYENIDILILDDCSHDKSREIIQRYCDLYPGRVRSLFNLQNSGNVFRQWRKGVEQSEGDLVWICESDDFCEPDFIEHLIPHFRDRSVNLAFGRIQFSDQNGRPRVGLDQYREGAEAGIWNESMVRPASEWFARGFGVNNLIANVGGCLWRRQILPAAVWAEAESFSVVGDWFLYCHLAGGGNIAYEPASVAYFRQHGQNTSVSAFMSAPYYIEHHRLMTLLRKTWDVPDETVERFMSKVAFQYKHFDLERKLGPLNLYVDGRALLEVKRQRSHIMLAFLGFHTGGGEAFPINLANELHAQGHLVSMIALDMSHINQHMIESLNPAIAVYDADQVVDTGVDRFVAEAGVSLIHSHMALLEIFFFEHMKLTANIPYIVSLHGSYESADLSVDFLKRITKGVTHWVYTADRNLEPLRAASIPEAKLTKLGNGMPHDDMPFPQTRKELGISDDAVVFTLVARGILRKGWRASISAFIKLRDRHPGRQLHLLLCGDGEQVTHHERTYGSEPGITFLGYQSRISGLYRISDVALVPSRFGGESFPLCIIQAMQVGTPIISTRVGEIEHMVAPHGHPPCGLIIDPVRDTDHFIQLLEAAMEDMLSDTLRKKCAKSAKKLGERYSISNVANDYIRIYNDALHSPASESNDPEEGQQLELTTYR
ncbi:glycosyltransferase [Mesorhizobium sp. M0621]|uniref:glycosyltransferase n=1 Tax=Mesorhizobium sp. M0621 TaxID=2956974 RepID=UPI0033352CD4